MGRALVEGWTQKNIPLTSLTVITPNKATVSHLHQRFDLTWFDSPEALPEPSSFDVLLFAVKPQILPAVLPRYRHLLNNNPLVVSVVAGKTKAFFQTFLHNDLDFLRAMPNLPVAFCQGTISAWASPKTERTQRVADLLFDSVGSLSWLPQEDDFHIATAVSGCGPAYLFLLTDILENEAEKHGLSPDLARKLIRQTFLGAANLSYMSEKTSPELTNSVASQGGVTQAALDQLTHSDPSLKDVFHKAVTHAIHQSKALGGV